MRNWKVAERVFAGLLGCERVPVSGNRRGRAFADLISDWLSAEVKTRKRLPVFLADAIDSAERGAEYAKARDGKDRLPLVLIHADHANYRRSLVVMRFGDADDYFGLTTDPLGEEF